MAHNVQLTNLAVNTMGDAFAPLLDNGYLRIYDGTQPANGDTAIGAQVLLAELRWNATAFPATVAGVLTANALIGDSSANATGTATWFRALKADGTTSVWDGSVGTSNADMVLVSVSITMGQIITINAAGITLPKS